jgi:hypothetical protein
MLDIFNIITQPETTYSTFYSTSATTLTQWQTWRKPRGCNFVYILGVGGGGAGSSGIAGAAAGGGGGAGGGSGSQTTVLIPAMLIPDVLYIQAGNGGIGTNTGGVAGTNGLPTYVSVEPSTTLTPNVILLRANGGFGGGASASNAGSTGGIAGTAAATTEMPLAGRGKFNILAGIAGTGGGARGAAGVSLTLSVSAISGVMVTGGTGAGGALATPGAGGNITGVGALNIFPTLSGGAAANNAIPATAGQSGFIEKNFLMNYGGCGGGGGDDVAGGVPGAGGTGAPGCGGGGSGGASTNAGANTLARAGDGGGGFVMIFTW